jgi:hypothetical protein
VKVYISCHHPDPANELAVALTSAGHTVVSTWHTSAEPRPDHNDVRAWAYKCGENFDQIMQSELLVLVGGPDKYPGGKFIEAGYAYATGVKVMVLGRRENGMVALFGFADDTATLLTLIRGL